MDHTQQLLAHLRAEAPGAAAQAAAIGAPLCYGADTGWFSDPSPCFDALLEDLRRAEKAVWLAAPVIVPGVMWETVLSVLRRKAARGVDVRLVWDGRRSRLPICYANQLASMRIHGLALYRGRPFRALLIDGTLLYTGGLELRDGQIGLRCRRGERRVGMLRLHGAAEPVCGRFLALFPDAAPPACGPQAQTYNYVSFFSDAPAVLTGLIRRTECSVRLMAPGLPPGRAAEALRLAAASGVEVHVLLNRRPCRKLPGVRIAEDGRRIAGWACVADGRTAMIAAGREGVWLHGRGAAGIEADLRAMFDSPDPRAYSGWKGRYFTWSRGFPDR